MAMVAYCLAARNGVCHFGANSCGADPWYPECDFFYGHDRVGIDTETDRWDYVPEPDDQSINEGLQ